MFLEALDKLLADQATGAAVRRMEADGPDTAVWKSIAQAGFFDLMLGEERGGAGLPLTELFPLFQRIGRYGIPLPLAQTIVARAMMPSPDLPSSSVVTLATRLTRPVSGGLYCPYTPSGMLASHVLACDAGQLVVLDCANARREPVGDRRGLVAHLSWSDASAATALGAGGDALVSHAAALTAALLSGAMQRCLEMTLEQCNNRVQFGKSIGKFQALQQQLSVMAEHVLASAIAAECAYRGDGPAPAALAAAVAKSRCSEAVGVVAATAHAVHGAIGMTDEFDLGILTRRMHEWRLQYGAEQHWNQQIGTQVLACGQRLSEMVRAV